MIAIVIVTFIEIFYNLKLIFYSILYWSRMDKDTSKYIYFFHLYFSCSIIQLLFYVCFLY